MRRDGAVVLLSALAFTFVAFTYPLDRVVGAGFVLALLAYLTYAYVQEMKISNGGHTAAYDKAEAIEEVLGEQNDPRPTDAMISTPIAMLMAVLGLAIIIFGGKLLVDGAVGIARAWGVTETVIGLTIVAVGTSMPELVTSVIAAMRKHTDVAVGNVLGSNIYNILGIGGITGLIAPTEIPTEIVLLRQPGDGCSLGSAFDVRIHRRACLAPARRHPSGLLCDLPLCADPESPGRRNRSRPRPLMQ